MKIILLISLFLSTYNRSGFIFSTENVSPWPWSQMKIWRRWSIWWNRVWSYIWSFICINYGRGRWRSRSWRHDWISLWRYICGWCKLRWLIWCIICRFYTGSLYLRRCWKKVSFAWRYGHRTNDSVLGCLTRLRIPVTYDWCLLWYGIFCRGWFGWGYVIRIRSKCLI